MIIKEPPKYQAFFEEGISTELSLQVSKHLNTDKVLNAVAKIEGATWGVGKMARSEDILSPTKIDQYTITFTSSGTFESEKKYLATDFTLLLLCKKSNRFVEILTEELKSVRILMGDKKQFFDLIQIIGRKGQKKPEEVNALIYLIELDDSFEEVEDFMSSMPEPDQLVPSIVVSVVLQAYRQAAFRKLRFFSLTCSVVTYFMERVQFQDTEAETGATVIGEKVLISEGIPTMKEHRDQIKYEGPTIFDYYLYFLTICQDESIRILDNLPENQELFDAYEARRNEKDKTTNSGSASQGNDQLNNSQLDPSSAGSKSKRRTCSHDHPNSFKTNIKRRRLDGDEGNSSGLGDVTFKIKDFTFGPRLGKGRSLVLQAEYNGEVCAVKKACDDTLISELQNEVRIYQQLKSLQGERVPQMISYGFADTGEYFILFKVYKPAPARLALSQMKYLYKTLKMVHSKGIKHNDLKMVNVLMNDSDLPLLSDFASNLKFDSNHPSLEFKAEKYRSFGNIKYVPSKPQVPS